MSDTVTVTDQEDSTGRKRGGTVRKASSDSLDTALFGSDHDENLFSSDDNDEGQDTDRHGSQSSSLDRERRRELKILLAPSLKREPRSCCHSMTTTTSISEDTTSNDEKGSPTGSLESASTSPFGVQFASLDGVLQTDPHEDDALRTYSSKPRGSLMVERSMTHTEPRMGGVSSEDETEWKAPTSSLESDTEVKSMSMDSRSDVKVGSHSPLQDSAHSSHRIGSQSLLRKSISSPESVSALLSRSSLSEPVDAGSDPLLGSVVEEPEYPDTTLTNVLSDGSRKKSVAEQEDERRSGFAVAYQQRLMGLSMRLWAHHKDSRRAREPSHESEQEHSSSSTAETDEASHGLLSSGWRHLTTLPNLLLMPTFGSGRHITEPPSTTEDPPREVDPAQSAKRNEALCAAQAAVAHLATAPHIPSDHMRNLDAIDSAKATVQALQQPTDAEPPLMPQDRSNSTTAQRGRGVMTPQEADADISAYVPGLGLPIDPDLELSSVVHLQTFRLDPSRRRGTISGDSERKIAVEASHRRTISDSVASQAQAVPVDEKAEQVCAKPAHPVANVSTTMQLSTKAPKHRRLHIEGSSRRCSRPAVEAPVPGNYSAYNSEEESDTSDREPSVAVSARSSSRGRNGRSRRRSSPPPTRQQCAIGLFSASPKARGGRGGRTSGRSSGHSSPTHEAPPMRIRSSPDLPSLANAVRVQADDGCNEEERRDGRRGRAGEVKRVSASGGRLGRSSRTLSNMRSPFPSSIMAGSAAAAAAASAHADGAPSVGERTADVSTGTRLSLIGSSGMQNLAGRPSMVSNGAHLLMLSLELEMMRNQKITGSLKPRWLKARMRAEPYGPTAVLAMVAREQQQTEDECVETGKRAFSPRSSSNLRFEL